MTTAMLRSSQPVVPLETPIHPSCEEMKTPRSTQPSTNASSHVNVTAPLAKPGLPPPHILLFAADVYFRYCYNNPYSLFHEDRFRQRLANGEIPEYLVWAFLASARRFSTIPHHHFEGGDTVGDLARRSWETFNVPWDGPETGEEALAILQTVVILVTVEHTGKWE